LRLVLPPPFTHARALNLPASTETHTLSLHDALPICTAPRPLGKQRLERPPAKLTADRQHTEHDRDRAPVEREAADDLADHPLGQDRKSTRLNSSHVKISYAVFCLKKKKNLTTRYHKQ